MTKCVMDNVCWSFFGSQFESKEQFRTELLDFQDDLDFDDSLFDEVCFIAPEITIEYWCYEGDLEVTKQVVINADNGSTLSPLEVLFKFHNLTVFDFNNIDHHFYEGLIPLPESTLSSPKFKVWQGS